MDNPTIPFEEFVALTPEQREKRRQWFDATSEVVERVYDMQDSSPRV